MTKYAKLGPGIGIYWKTPTVYLCIVTGLVLLGLNLTGLALSLRPVDMSAANYRFGERDLRLDLQEFEVAVNRKLGESELDYANRLTHVIADGIAHIHWERYSPDKFNQRVPAWENYILWAMGHVTDIPEYRRYHFSDVRKSMERGIGICGDASMLMSQLLERNKIPNRIISMPGHVVVEADLGGDTRVFDPDFGVTFESSITELKNSPSDFRRAYLDRGYRVSEVRALERSLALRHRYWDGVSHFITKKYYFEKFSYLVKWALPVALLLLAFQLRASVSLRKH